MNFQSVTSGVCSVGQDVTMSNHALASQRQSPGAARAGRLYQLITRDKYGELTIDAAPGRAWADAEPVRGVGGPVSRRTHVSE